MAYWLAITSRGNWKHVRSLNRWAVSLQHESLLKRTHPGDGCVVYVTSDGGRYSSALAGAFQIVSYPVRLEPEDRRTLFDHLYPCQDEITVLADLEEPIPFYPFVSRLALIRKPHAWGAYLQGSPMRHLSTEDFRVLQEALLAAKEVAP